MRKQKYLLMVLSIFACTNIISTVHARTFRGGIKTIKGSDIYLSGNGTQFTARDGSIYQVVDSKKGIVRHIGQRSNVLGDSRGIIDTKYFLGKTHLLKDQILDVRLSNDGNIFEIVKIVGAYQELALDENNKPLLIEWAGKMVTYDRILKKNDFGELEILGQLVHKTVEKFSPHHLSGRLSDLRLYDKNMDLYIDVMKNGQMYSGGGVYNEAGELQYTIIKGIKGISLQAETFGKIFTGNDGEEWNITTSEYD